MFISIQTDAGVSGSVDVTSFSASGSGLHSDSFDCDSLAPDLTTAPGHDGVGGPLRDRALPRRFPSER